MAERVSQRLRWIASETTFLYVTQPHPQPFQFVILLLLRRILRCCSADFALGTQIECKIVVGQVSLLYFTKTLGLRKKFNFVFSQFRDTRNPNRVQSSCCTGVIVVLYPQCGTSQKVQFRYIAIRQHFRPSEKHWKLGPWSGGKMSVNDGAPIRT